MAIFRCNGAASHLLPFLAPQVRYVMPSSPLEDEFLVRKSKNHPIFLLILLHGIGRHVRPKTSIGIYSRLLPPTLWLYFSNTPTEQFPTRKALRNKQTTFIVSQLRTFTGIHEIYPHLTSTRRLHQVINPETPKQHSPSTALQHTTKGFLYPILLPTIFCYMGR